MSEQLAKALIESLTLEEKKQLNEFLKQLEASHEKKDC